MPFASLISPLLFCICANKAQQGYQCDLTELFLDISEWVFTPKELTLRGRL